MTVPLDCLRRGREKKTETDMSRCRKYLIFYALNKMEFHSNYVKLTEKNDQALINELQTKTLNHGHPTVYNFFLISNF